jgi:two-component system, sensor histidine kinase and response regulator
VTRGVPLPRTARREGDRMKAPFDREALLERIDGDAELLGDLFGDFLADTDQHLATARIGVSDKDFKTLYEGAHALRGCVANFCANAAFEIASELQNLASSENHAAAATALTKLEAEIKRVTESLRALVDELK